MEPRPKREDEPRAESTLHLHHAHHKESDYDDTNFIDLEESKAMLRQEMTQATYDEPKKSKGVRGCVQMSSILINCAFFIFILFLLHNPCHFSSRSCRYTDSNGLVLMAEEHDYVPQFGLEKVTFMNDSNYANEDMFASGTEFDRILKNWDKDMPLGRGFIQLPDSAVPDLPRPYRLRHFPERNGYSIASLHQFHCIYMIMRAFGDNRLGRPALNDDMERHVTHCFDYLRQSSQCAGDSTLEGVSATVKHKTDGWGNTHICKKNSELVQWVYDNRLSDYTGIH